MIASEWEVGVPGTVELSVDRGLGTLLMTRAHGNAINGELVDDMIAACRQAEEDEGIRGVMLAGAGKLFSPGLDLQELIEMDRGEIEHFLGRFSECLTAMYGFSKPMLARIHGHAVAGGCVFALTADWRVLTEDVLVGLNEVQVGVPLPFSVAMILRESVPSPKIEEVALFGRNYRGPEAVSAGLAHEVRPAEGFDEHCRERLDELAAKDARAFSITKRYLRSPVMQHIRDHDEKWRDEFVESWFSAGTRDRLQAVVEGLRSRSGMS
jgi:enoyl-CoA hydratase